MSDRKHIFLQHMNPIKKTDQNSEIRQIELPDIPKEEIKIDKRKCLEKVKRVFTHEESWTFSASDLTPEKQKSYISQIHNNNEIVDISLCKIIIKQMNHKIHGYRTQDVLKNLLDENNFVGFLDVLDLYIKSDGLCYYCKKHVQILYEYVREPSQWTLDRIDNLFGHNRDNVLLACLSCNLARRTMYTERYSFTKQLTISKKG